MPAARHRGDEVMTHTCCQSTQQRRNDTERTPVRRRVESSSGDVRADGVFKQILQDYYIQVKQHREYNEHECLIIIDIVLIVCFFYMGQNELNL